MLFLLTENINAEITLEEKTFFDNVIETLLKYKNYYEIIVFIFLIFAIIITLFAIICNKKVINSKSLKAYKKNEKNGKFINDLYVELGDANESLRYMYHSYWWLNRIRIDFYKLLHTRLGKMMAKRNNIKFYNYLTKKGLYTSLIKCQNFLDNCRKFDENDERNFMYYLSHNSFYLRDEIQRLVNNIEMIDTNVCFLLGKAGCGKTNLLTNFVKKIINNYSKICIYIDAKDIEDNDVENKFLSYFDSPFILKGNKKVINSILLFIKRLFNSEILVIIEAINENSNQEFYKNLCRFVNKYYKNKNIKIIISSRTEFYNIKFKNIFDEYLDSIVKYKIVSIENSKISEHVLEKMFNKYKKHFCFNGSVTENVKRLLYDSPILMRIFFECYRDTDVSVVDIDKSKLFSEYISELEKKYPVLKKTLKEITNKMVDSNKFDYIKVAELSIDFTSIETLIYEHVLLTKSIIENQGQINEEKAETISITYDEIRDYLVTNLLIEKYESSSLNIQNYIDEIIKNKLPIAEGVLKNLYCYFKSENQEVCKYILNVDFLKKFNFGNRDMFTNAHLDFIFSTKKELDKFELDYLEKLDYIAPKDLARIIFISIYNMIYSLKPDSKFIIDKMKSFMENKETIFDFSTIDIKWYLELINNLEKYQNENIESLRKNLMKLVKFLENNYENI